MTDEELFNSPATATVGAPINRVITGTWREVGSELEMLKTIFGELPYRIDWK